MNIIRDLNELDKPLKNPVLTIGNFDGVHKGHLILYEKVKERAGSIDGQSAVMTFDPHPIKVMKPGNGPPLITPISQKLDLISKAGIDVIFCLTFSRQFAAISAEDFVKDILLKKIGVKELVVGYDYTFGYKRLGNIDLLLSKLMRDDPIDRADAQFIVQISNLSVTDITTAIAEARLPESPEIQEQFELASRRLLKTLAS